MLTGDENNPPIKPIACKRMFRYYQKALKELEKSTDKQQAVAELGEQHYERNVIDHASVNNQKRKKHDERDRYHKREKKRDKKLRKTEKRNKTMEDLTTIEAVTKHDHANVSEVRKKTKKKKRRHLDSDAEAANSSDRERCTTQFDKSRVTESSIVSSNNEIKKKRKRKSVTEFSERAVKKSKQSVQTSESRKHRVKEKCDEMHESDFSCNQRTENMHTTSAESSTLEQKTHNLEISAGSSPQPNSHLTKKSSLSGKQHISTERGKQQKKRKKRTDNLMAGIAVDKDNFLNGSDNKKEVTKSRVGPTIISNIKIDEAKLREATAISNKIHETWTLPEERLKALAEKGE